MASGVNPSEMVLLNLLTMRPMSGYDMWEEIGRSIGLVWSESFSQIYPALESLSAKGFIKRMPKLETTTGPKARKVYAITPSGKKQLTEWMSEPYKVRNLKSELLLKFCFGYNAEPGITLRNLEVFRATQRELLQIIDEQEQRFQKDLAGHEQLPYWMLMVRFGRMQSSMYLEWIDEAVREVEKLDRARRPKQDLTAPKKLPKVRLPKYATY